MPGPVSDSYDPEFGTGANADDVREGIEAVVHELNGRLGSELVNIVAVTQGGPGKLHPIRFSERELRLIRFGLLRALDSL